MREKYFLLTTLVIIFGHIVKRNECNGERSNSKWTRTELQKHSHVASIRLRPLDDPFGNGHICSGTLFTVNKILSSADCLIQDIKKYRFFNPSKLRIVLGIQHRFYKRESTVVISSGVKYAYHPKYDIETGENDISVIFFQKGILINHPYIKPLPLIQNSPDVGLSCMVTSWSFNITTGTTSRRLVDSPMLVLPREKCTQTKLGGLICAHNNSSKSHEGCSSELGEGLICDSKLAGVVAYDISCRWHEEKSNN